MKRFLLQLTIFLLLFAAIDFFFGKLLQYGELHAIGGDTEKHYYIHNKSCEDILIFGSSRSSNHYSPRVLEDSLHMTVYNCGENETGIVCFYPKLNMIKQRYTPKIIICDIYYVDLLDSLRFQNIDFLKTLKTSYGTQCVDTMFIRYASTSKIKMLSGMYRYNSLIYSILVDNFRTTNWYYKGFYCLSTQKIKNVPIVDNTHHCYIYDTEKLRLLERLIIENKDRTRIFFAISPEFGKTNDEMYSPVKELCKQYNIPLLNHLCDTTFTRHKELFSNQNHLNIDGATLYTKIISKEIRLLHYK